MAERVVLAETWGFMKGTRQGPWYSDCYRTPLPVVGPHVEAYHVGLREVHPPYITTEVDRDVVAVMICDASGSRATVDGQGQAEDTAWLYADSKDLPVEWREPVAEALRVVRAIWPRKRVVANEQETIAYYEDRSKREQALRDARRLLRDDRLARWRERAALRDVA